MELVCLRIEAKHRKYTTKLSVNYRNTPLYIKSFLTINTLDTPIGTLELGHYIPGHYKAYWSIKTLTLSSMDLSYVSSNDRGGQG